MKKSVFLVVLISAHLWAWQSQPWDKSEAGDENRSCTDLVIPKLNDTVFVRPPVPEPKIVANSDCILKIFCWDYFEAINPYVFQLKQSQEDKCEVGGNVGEKNDPMHLIKVRLVSQDNKPDATEASNPHSPQD